MMKYTIEKGNGSLTWIYITEPNRKEETLTIELSECKNLGGKNALPYLWHKAGYTDKILDTYLCIHTYCTDSEGNCYGLSLINISEPTRPRLSSYAGFCLKK